MSNFKKSLKYLALGGLCLVTWILARGTGGAATCLDFWTYITAAQSQPRDTWVDPSGFIYVSGLARSVNLVGPAGMLQPVFAGGPDDVFICKFSPSHVRMWCSSPGTRGPMTEEEIYRITGYDPVGNLAVCGSMRGPVSNIAGVPVHDISPLTTSVHPFVAKIKSDGPPLLWFTAFDEPGRSQSWPLHFGQRGSRSEPDTLNQFSSNSRLTPNDD